MHAVTSVNPWTIKPVAWRRGGRVIVPRQYAPLAPVLPYRRAAGEHPPDKDGVETIRRLGWSVVLGNRGLGDVLLALGLVQALADGPGNRRELHYQGPRPRLMRRCRLEMTTSTGDGPHTVHTGHGAQPKFEAVPGIEVLAGLDAVDCLDVFASAELVIGNDTGLTHLAALTERADGTGPEVIGLYGRHAHTKWITGSTRHHAIATPFSQMLAVADRCPVRDDLDDSLWNQSANLAYIPAEAIAEFARQVVGW